jgi:hypothetical protein
MTTPTPLNSGPHTANRLTGWKEIAAYLGKGVRTVQRWEKELDLPVRRLGTGRGEVVFAVPSELDAWLVMAEKRSDLGGRPGEEDVEPAAEWPHAASPAPESLPTPPAGSSAGFEISGARRLSRHVAWTIGAALVVGGLALSSWWWLGRAPRQPYMARIERGRLCAYDDSGSLLWEYRFSVPIPDAENPGEADGRIRPVVSDLDGDGD